MSAPPAAIEVDRLIVVRGELEGEGAGDVAADVAVVVGFAVLALAVGAATLRRRTP